LSKTNGVRTDTKIGSGLSLFILVPSGILLIASSLFFLSSVTGMLSGNQSSTSDESLEQSSAKTTTDDESTVIRCDEGQTLKWSMDIDGWDCGDDIVSVSSNSVITIQADPQTGDLITTTPGLTISGGDNVISGSGSAINITTANASVQGLLSASDWTDFDNKEELLTFADGLTRSGDYIVNDLNTGYAGGQSIFGGTAANEGLIIDSTTNSTKGEIILNPSGGNVILGGDLTISGVTYTWPVSDGASGEVLGTDSSGNLSWVSTGGIGTVTSVGLSMPSIFTVNDSPVTASGTLSTSLNTQNANLVFAGPTSGLAAVPTFRGLVSNDIPSLSSLYIPQGDNLFTLASTLGSNSTISDGGTVTIAAGTGISTTNNAAGTITVANTGVTSVALSLPNIFSISGSPVTTTGTLTGTLATQNANLVFAGPTSGGAATPGFRSLVATDIPDLSATYYKQDGNAFGEPGILGLTDNNQLSLITNNQERIVIESGGQVAIGAASAAGALDVTGTLFLRNLTGAGATQGALCQNNTTKEVTINAGGSTCLLSSAKYKYDISDSTAGLDIVMALRPVEYKYIGTNEERLGLIAEEVDQVESRLVIPEEDGSPRSVRYEELTSVLAKAIQEQQIMIEDLEQELSGLTVSGAMTPDEILAALENAEIERLSINSLTSGVIIADTITTKDLIVTGEFNLSSTYIGQVTIPAGGLSRSVTFTQPHATVPVVNVTPLEYLVGNFKLTNISAQGFTIELESPQVLDIGFNWIAVD
jgi:hypothetical protein